MTIFTEARDDVTRQTIGDRESLEALPYWGDIVHAAVEGAGPQTALGITGDAIDEAVIGLVGRYLQLVLQAPPLSGLRVYADHTVVAADADTVVGSLVQGEDVDTDICFCR